MTGLTIGIPTYGRWADHGPARLLDVARIAEAHGVRRISVTDHVLLGGDTDDYPFGAFPVPPTAPWFEPLSFLSAVAAVTSTIRLETRVLIAPLRPAALLAKIVATLDQLSEGRVDLGVGTGWMRDEFEAQGLDVDRRGELLTDTLAACRVLWSESPSSFTSANINFDGVYSHPQPFQSRLPIWIGGNVQARSIDRLRWSGDGWIPPAGAAPELVRSGVSRLSEELGGLDRNFVVQVALGARPGDVGAPSIPALVEQVPSYADAGATDVSVDLGMVTDGPDEAERTIKEILRRFDDVTA